jgi:hypothetical protein
VKPAVPIILLLLLTAACEKARRGNPDEAPGGDQPAVGTAVAETVAAKPPAFPRREVSPCPECEGLGRCIRCGSDRPCYLCDGGGRCAQCDGTGNDREGRCLSCEGRGDCLDCAGDGVVGNDGGESSDRRPGQCPLCHLGSGFCLDCGGNGKLSDGRGCSLCDGAKRCPDCRGSGRDVWCAGTGNCGSCLGHGQVFAGGPGTGWPPFRLALRDGATITGDLLRTPETTITIEHEKGGRVVRESIVESRVEPLSFFLARRRFIDPDDPAHHEALVEQALRHGEELLFLARVELAEFARLAPKSPRIEALRLELNRRFETRIRTEAEDAFGRTDDPQRAWVLYQLLLAAWPDSPRAEAVRERADVALARLRADVAGLSDEMHARKRQAEEARLHRAVRRAEDWRARAEDILVRHRPDFADLERARRAAREAFLASLRAADRTPPEVDRVAALTEGARGRSVEVRTAVALATRLMEVGMLDRARAAGAIASALDPGDEGARRFTAVIEEALAKRALEGGGH